MRDKLFPLLAWLFDGYWPLTDKPIDGPLTLRSPQRTYTIHHPVTDTPTADIVLASAGERDYLLKLARDGAGKAALLNERQVLTRLAAAAEGTTYRAYLPTLVESFRTPVRPARGVNVFPHEADWHTLEQVRARHPALEGRHLAWIFNRLLTILGFVHRQNVVHGAVLPDHVLIHAPTHSLRLIGWGSSVAPGQLRSRRGGPYADWQPPEVVRGQGVTAATDLFLAARCLVYLAGSDPLTDALPDHVPAPMRQFLATCLLPSLRMRPDDAWNVLDDFARLLRQLYGPPRFVELALT